MDICNLLLAPAGSVILLCCPAIRQKRMVDTILREIPSTMNTGSKCRSNVLHMVMQSDHDPHEFRDLNTLAYQLVKEAGYAKRYEGLVLLNIADIMDGQENDSRLKTLGEFLSLSHGMTASTKVILYGPTNGREMLHCVDLLDTHGDLIASDFAHDVQQTSHLAELLMKHNFRYENREHLEQLEKAYQLVKDCPAFNEDKYIHSLVSGQVVTTAALDNPYSYHNRLLASKKETRSERRVIGFGS